MLDPARQVPPLIPGEYNGHVIVDTRTMEIIAAEAGSPLHSEDWTPFEALLDPAL